MTVGEYETDRLRQEDFIVDAEVNQSAKGQTDAYAEGTHIVGKEVSGQFFDAVSFSLEPNSTVAIIGDNVRGRDEILEVMAGFAPPSQGKLTFSKKSKIEYVTPSFSEHEMVDAKHKTIMTLFMEARGIAGMEERMSELYMQSAEDETALEKAGELQQIFESAGGYDAQSDAEQIISGLRIGVNEHDTITLDTDLTSLSSGQISKVIIGRALFSRAPIILMNDPSVHLDVKSKEWLQSYIQKSKQTIVISTSDILFAEEIATKIIEVTDTGLVIQCSTDYQTFITERERILNQWSSEASQKLKEIEEKRTYVKEFLGPIATRSASMGQAKRATETQISRLEDEYAVMPGKKINENKRAVKECKFETGEVITNKELLRLESLRASYRVYNSQETPDVVSIDALSLISGDRLAVIGRNGGGKSTLLKALSPDNNEDLSIEGKILLADKTETAYMSPLTKLSAAPDATIVDVLKEASQGKNVGIGNIMEYWGFKRSEHYDTPIRDMMHKDEIARLQLALIMARKADLIMLDEPTSYLTPVYRERLIKSLKQYKGTLLVVSHDPQFLEELELTGTVEMPGGKLKKV